MSIELSELKQNKASFTDEEVFQLKERIRDHEKNKKGNKVMYNISLVFFIIIFIVSLYVGITNENDDEKINILIGSGVIFIFIIFMIFMKKKIINNPVPWWYNLGFFNFNLFGR